MTTRKQVPCEIISLCINEFRIELNRRLAQKGHDGFSSTHEIFGVVHEEVQELGDALRANDNKEFRQELFDILVGCLFGIASIDAHTTDW